MFSVLRKIIPSKNERELKRLRARVPAINDFEPKLKALPDAQLQAKTAQFRERYERAYADLGGDPKIRFTEGNKEQVKAERKRIDQALEPLLPEGLMTSLPSVRVSANGFSQCTCLPACKALIFTSVWACGVVRLRMISSSLRSLARD